ncbi:MAG: hypothetical protein AVDCRST_MAG59-3447 [uncultured Thermomicrobiales bacterium]|uniref:Uncharacterized protein n=1 Tax=uncultured Thermomicrobiales bacterium TaxID=1645740 RepID=A0A6J4V6T4_9BACT|nr:MAG: hypothetical protein AVDCRST_MAG59-3447 [uncultured Thermomicrobiales bacterium]
MPTSALDLPALAPWAMIRRHGDRRASCRRAGFGRGSRRLRRRVARPRQTSRGRAGFRLRRACRSGGLRPRHRLSGGSLIRRAGHGCRRLASRHRRPARADLPLAGGDADDGALGDRDGGGFGARRGGRRAVRRDRRHPAAVLDAPDPRLPALRRRGRRGRTARARVHGRSRQRRPRCRARRSDRRVRRDPIPGGVGAGAAVRDDAGHVGTARVPA